MSGLEVIGSVASVLQLAATVYSISKTLYEVGDALSNAPSDIKDLARDLETFSEELHLLSSLLSDETHRYSDRVYRLTAKIIGDCASICVKIDRILRKLRSGSFVARVKWVFKEKEIMKLLARLRDLKLSLMGTLSLLSALKADHLMDAMGVGNPSLLEGPKDERLSKETAEDLEETRKKLGGITAGQNPGSSLPAMVSGSTLTPSVSQSSEDSQQSVTSSEKGTDAPDASQSFSSSATSLKSTVSSHVSPKPRSIEQSNAQIFISAIALPQPNAVMQIPHAMASVQSFYSAFSRHDNEDLEGADAMNGNIAASDITPSSTKTHSPQKLADSRVEEWKADIIHSAMKRFGMTREDAISWVSALPVPSFPDSGVQDNAFLVDEDPERVQKKTDDAGGTGPKGMGQMSRNFRRFACPARPLTPSPERYCEVAMDCDEGRAWLKANREARRRMRRSSKSVRKRTLAQSIGSSSDDEDIEDSLSDTAAEEFHENQVQIEIDDSYNQQAIEEYITTVDLPGQWISDGDYSEDTHHGVKRRATTRPDERSLAEGALSGAGSAALLRDHDTATIPSPWKRGKPTGQTIPSTLASKLSNLTLSVESGRSSPASDDSMGPPPVPIVWKRGKPAALCLATLNTKPLQQAKLSQAPQSLKSARPLTVHSSSVYPPGISPPKGDGLRYDIEFLLQFQQVFTEEPIIDFKSRLEALEVNGNNVSTGSVLKRKVQGVIVRKHPISYRPASARPGLGTKAPTSEDRGEIDVRRAARAAVGAEVITRARSQYRESGQDKSRSPTKSWSGPWNATPVSQQHVSQNVSDEDAEGEECEDERNQDVDFLMLPSPANEAGSFSDEDIELGLEAELEEAPKSDGSASEEDNQLPNVSQRKIQNHYPGCVPPGVTKKALLKKHRRASRPKVKTGCSNCKVRRVKCDETRPQCQKCVKSGRQCDGYPAYKRTVLIAIAPKDGSATIKPSSSLSTTSLVPPARASFDHLTRREFHIWRPTPPTPPTIHLPSPTGPTGPTAFLRYFHHYVPYRVRCFIYEQGPKRSSFNVEYPRDIRLSTPAAGSQFQQVSTANPLPIAPRPGPLGVFPTAQIPEEKTEEGMFEPLPRFVIPCHTNSFDDDAMYENGFQDDFFSYEEEMGDADEDVDDLKDEIQFSSQPAKLEDSLRKIPVPAPPFLSDYRQNDLWVRAFAQLNAQDSESCQGLSRAWVAACENSPPLTGSEHLVAGMAATRLWSVVDKARMQLLETPTEAKRSTISSINRFSDILKVMQETLNFKTGFYIWTCLCFVEQEILESLSMSQVSKNSRTFVDLSEVATLVARYNVLESMYKQWPGMSLEPNYENSLIELCVRVLRYLDLILSRPSTSGQNDFEERGVALMAMIRSADVACRGFSVTIVGEVESKGMERDVEDISADEDDSDSTERG